MKQLTFLKSITVIAAVLTTFYSVSSCKKENANNDEKTNNPAPLKLESFHSYVFVENDEKQKITSTTPGSTLLYDTRGHTPIIAPDGHQMTLAEYNTPSGSAEVKCTEKGTHVTFHLKGLIPGGIYTVWVVPFKFPGFDGTFANQIGNGALGAADGSENQFKISADGTSSLSVTMPEGPLSIYGSVPACLSGIYETHMAIAYHSDQMSHGGSPGTGDTWVIPFAFAIFGSQL